MSAFFHSYLRQTQSGWNGDYYGTDDEGIPFEFPTINQYYKHTKQDNFSKIPGAPVAYWVSDRVRSAFEKEPLYKRSSSPSQNVTGNNEKYVRKHWELISQKIGGRDDWIFYAKGGGFRKWWGNLLDVVNWTPGARRIYQHGDGKHASQIINREYWYKQGVTWGLITSSLPSFRVMPEGATYDKGGSTIIVDEDVFYYTLGLLNSKVCLKIVGILNPSLNFQVKDIRSVPLLIGDKEETDLLVNQCVALSKQDWDAFETSWDFQRHPLIRPVSTIAEAFRQWENECAERFDRLKANEEQLNRIFIDIYGLQDELSPDVDDKDVTVRKADLQRDIRSFLSYAAGCMFGRYSLDGSGLAYAGGPWDPSQYSAFPPVPDDIIPICDDEYFDDDMTARFVKFVETVYGTETLEENLRFIADALGGKGASREVIRNYFLNGFYADHLKTYQKRPIYWLFDSGKRNAFKCLIYLHRYRPDTIARIRTDYVHEQQARYRTELSDLEKRVEKASTSERVKLSKRLTALRERAEELRLYEEKIHHLADRMIAIDLDDGVKRNYELFKDVLAKIK